MRLQKYLAACGIGSRRSCEKYIQEGKVCINNKKITELGIKVQEKDVVTFEGKKVLPKKEYVYYLLHKPVGYVTTVKDEKNRPTVIDFFKDIPQRVYPVGRLDYHTSGLLLLTNDGELTYELTHPKHHIGKTYEVTVKGIVSDETCKKLEKGILLEGRYTSPAKVQLKTVTKQQSTFFLTIYEGRNRQIRKMCEIVGHPVKKLIRIAIGNIILDGLKVGTYRKLTKKEIVYLKGMGKKNV